jgi:hypothetical protein
MKNRLNANKHDMSIHGDPLGWIWDQNGWFEELLKNKWK